MKQWTIYARWIKRNLFFAVEIVDANTQEEALRIFRSHDFCLHSQLFQVHAIPETTFSDTRVSFVDAPPFAACRTVPPHGEYAKAQAA
jgi:hypothetical protein